MATRWLRHLAGCGAWPDHVNERGRVECACGRARYGRETLRKRLERVALGARVRARLGSFWGGLR